MMETYAADLQLPSGADVLCTDYRQRCDGCFGTTECRRYCLFEPMIISVDS